MIRDTFATHSRHDCDTFYETAAQNALKQIEDKKYATELEGLGIQQIIKLAIVFAGKDVLVLEA